MSKPRIITLHHTGGWHRANSTDINHYHFIVEWLENVEGGGLARVVKGLHPIANSCPVVKGRPYAMHTAMANSYNLGISLAGGGRGHNIRGKTQEYTRQQWEAACSLTAELCIKYGIEPNRQSVRTHAEVGIDMPRTANAGKPDIVALPWQVNGKWLSVNEIGNLYRSTVRWYINKQIELKENVSPIPDDGKGD